MKSLFYIVLLATSTLFAQNTLTHDVYFDTDKYHVPLTEENRLLLFISSLDSIAIEKANLITNVNGKGEILLKVLNEEEVHQIRGLNRKVEVLVTKQIPPKKEPEVVEETVVNEEVKKEKTANDIKTGSVKKGDKIRLDKIYFKTSYSYVTSESKKTLEELAKILVEKDNLYFTIQGHVCCTQMSRDAVDKKTKKRNLSVARAKYIYDYLARKGVDKKRMKYVGMRRKFPLGGEPKFDRRVEILVTYVGKEN